MAVGWGGLAGAVGLMIGAGRDWPARLAVVGVGFALGGMLATLRAPGRRALHAAGAWVAGWLIYAVFVLAAAVADLLGAPPEPELAPGTLQDAGLLAAWALGAALVGAGLAWRWLRPPPARRGRY